MIETLVRRAIFIFNRDGFAILLYKIITYIYKRVRFVLLFPLPFLIPSSNKLVIFNGDYSKEFSDNSKYLFLYLSNNSEYTCFWSSEYNKVNKMLSSNGYNACNSKSIKGKILALRSEYAVTHVNFSSHQYPYILSSKRVQLWHGIPLKKLDERHLNWMNKYFYTYEYACLNSSAELSELKKSRCFKNVLYTGSPRNDILFENISGSEIGVNPKARQIINRAAVTDTIIGYFPTYRRWGMKNDLFDPVKMDEYLQSVNGHLIIKMHRNTDEYINDSLYENIHVIPPTGDIYPLFNDIDIMITDYSSIYFDYLCLNRPIIFYPYDYEVYKKRRGFNLQYDENTPGPIVKNSNELISTIDSVMSEDLYQDQREQLLNSLVKNNIGGSSKRIYKKIFTLV